MTRQEFEASAKADNFKVPVYAERLPGYSMGDHQHPFDAFSFILSGDITLVVDGNPTTYKTGDTFWLNAGTPHLESSVEGVTHLIARRETAMA